MRQDRQPAAGRTRCRLVRDAAGQVARPCPTAEAIRYALNHWDGLVRFLDDGRIEIDSNTVERAMRPIASVAQERLFAGSDEGGENWAGDRLADRDLQAQRRQSASLLHRRADPPRQRMAAGAHRRTHAVAPPGIATSIIVNPSA